eukprot:scaffold35253_cov124-Isochrysis_galbana.AAC.1
MLAFAFFLVPSSLLTRQQASSHRMLIPDLGAPGLEAHRPLRPKRERATARLCPASPPCSDPCLALLASGCPCSRSGSPFDASPLLEMPMSDADRPQVG